MTKFVQVIFVDSDSESDAKKAQAAPGATLLQIAQGANVDIGATCGGRGRCRDCRVKILKGDVPPATVQDSIQLGHEEVHEHFRLSCQTRVNTDATVLIAPPKAEVGHQILAAGPGVDSDHVGLDSGVEKQVVTAKAPAEEHHQTSDTEEVLSALTREVSRQVPLDVLRKIPKVIRKQKGLVTVTTFNDVVIDVEPGDTTAHKYGMAFDIGTTSIVGNLIDLSTGEQLAAVGNVNPQAVYGGDLMSRIAFAQFDEKKLNKLRGRVLVAINEFVQEACDEAKVSPEHIYKVVIVGNTCMHHVFLGLDVTYVGLAPYAAAVRDPLVIPAKDLPLKSTPNAHVCFLPIVAGFVGADTMGAVLATRIYDSDEIRVMVDIGTNGEVVMGSRGKLMACSAPAGPALEGAQIRHGMRGAVGAIEKVAIDDDVECDVIGNAPAIGICGSGLIDAVAKMLDADVLEPSGRMRKEREALPPAVRERFIDGEGGSEFVLVRANEAGKDEHVTLTQTDIRQLQLAKGAIYAGIMMLQKVMEISDEQIEEVMLCGGFGNYINTESAVRIRLLPPLPLEKISYVGNAAHLGAQMALLSEMERNRAYELARQIEHVALATRPEFQDIFVDAINLTASPYKPSTTGKGASAAGGS
ncbi:MAG: ASKHA domain-containing protein [Acidiferrobacterales bacterium]